MDISVVIPTYDRDRELKRTIQDLCKQRGGFAFEIIVVDQNPVPVQSRDPDLYALSLQPDMRWVQLDRGVVRARNKAISVARGELLVFVDDDVEIDDVEFLAKHLRAHAESDGDVAAICGRETNPGGPIGVERLDYTRDGPMSDMRYFSRSYTKRVEATVLSTVNCSVKKKALLDVECFDERFSGASYGDDADLALRLVKRGYRVVYDPAPTLLHLLAPTGGLRLSTTNKRNPFSDTDKVLSGIVFYLKHVHNGYKKGRLHYIYRYILRRSLFLKANILRPWRLPRVVLALFFGFVIARRSLKQGHKRSF